MQDSFGRTIDYLRVSITDRCNFRCVYCMPEEGAPVAPKSDILSFEEIERLLRVAAGLGMRKVRLTGGEPLVRRDIETLIARIAAIPGIEDLSLTTNGFLLARLAKPLKDAGLRRVNISLDTLRPERFAAIARRGHLAEVLAGLDAALAAGLTPLKINMVVMKDVNADEVAEFAALTRERPLDVRFIELMPINWSSGEESMQSFYALSGASETSANRLVLYPRAAAATFRDNFHLPAPDAQIGMLNAAQMRGLFVSSAETRRSIEAAYGSLVPAEVLTNGPSRSFRLPGAVGTLGFISQITNDHCARCNRLRLTADGFLRPCLMADGEVDLRTSLRNGASDDDLRALFLHTVLHKPYEHRLEAGLAPVGRSMSQLGG